MTPKEYKALKTKKSKYGNKKITHKGIKFDSKKEFERYLALKDKEDKGLIAGLEVHPMYLLQEKFRDSEDKWQRAITYEADFSYFEDGKLVVEDVKSDMTRRLQHYRDKVKILKFKYPEIIFREIN